MKARWNNMTTRDRITNVLIIVLSVAVIALAALQLLGIWDDSINVYEPLIGVVLLLQAYRVFITDLSYGHSIFYLLMYEQANRLLFLRFWFNYWLVEKPRKL